jgi:pyridinium-3,5-bisthiocarboxylic acid mononucleotide nickel chelatase
MRTLYFDCFAGASGDMILGALVAAGVDPQTLVDQLSLLNVDGFTVTFEKTDRSGISATFARVETREEKKHRHLSGIEKIISGSQLSDGIKQRALKIFSRLGEAEARVHNQPLEKVHFHEVGALDAIVDVLGAAICFELLGIERFVCSPLHVGSGFVEMEHGRFPVPPPAVTELLKDAPLYTTDVKGELVTPTGAAIITTVCSEFGPMPQMILEHTGYGAGSRTYDRFPNVLRVLIGDDQQQAAAEERLWMIETNVDDMSPQIFAYVMDRAFDLGALDCYFTPVHMKKNRPAVLLSVLCHIAEREQLTRMLFAETTTLGVRFFPVERRALERKIVRVETQYGAIDVKVARLNGSVINEMPEFEQCREAARQANVPLRVVEEAARASLARSTKS